MFSEWSFSITNKLSLDLIGNESLKTQTCKMLQRVVDTKCGMCYENSNLFSFLGGERDKFCLMLAHKKRTIKDAGNRERKYSFFSH